MNTSSRQPDHTDYTSLMLALWQSACQDQPKRPSAVVKDGHFVLTISGNRSNWLALCLAAGVPGSAVQAVDGDTLTVRWESIADRIFGPTGSIAALLPKYEVRAPQLHMARLVQRAIEMGQPAVVEAGTGTGKSFAYAAVCMAMGKKVIISTSNKALQMQLIGKDLPFLQRIFPNKKVAVSVGKRNYVCWAKVRRDGIADPALNEWMHMGTLTGNTEEITFPVEAKTLATIIVDDECTGKHCPLYDECFYYRARDEMKDADVVVTNHALLCLDQVAEGHILPPADVLVIDEAHKLPDYMRSARGAELTAAQISRTIALAEGYADMDTAASALDALLTLERTIAIHTAKSADPQIGIVQETELDGAQTLARCLYLLADDVGPEDELPSDADEKKEARRAQRIRNAADKLCLLAGPTPAGYVRWLEQGRNGDPAKLLAQPFNVTPWIARLAGKDAAPLAAAADPAPTVPQHARCHRCHRELTAPKVAVLDGHPYGPDCIQQVDPFGDAETVNLSDWLALAQPAVPAVPAADAAPLPGKAVIFTSATLAAPDLAHFVAEAGLGANGESACFQMQAASPFDYAANALLYLPSATALAPNAAGWGDWAIDQMRQLVLASGGGAFLLFTSYRAMNEAVQQLGPVFAARRLHVLVQGEMPKAEIARRFREDGSAVLFATKSFFEGVSIDGSALRLVVVDKMPFEAPSPLLQAMEAALLERARSAGIVGKTLEMYPFNHLRVPRMVIELKQALGRLIRTQTDQGVMAVLDSRIRSAQYGRNVVLPSLPPAMLTSSIAHVQTFFGALPPLPAKLTAPPAEVRQEKRQKEAERMAVAYLPGQPDAWGEEIPF